MAVKKGKKQARRKDEPSIPGYVWLLAGLLIGGAVAVTAWIKMPHAVDDLLPHPNPGAKPQVASAASDASNVPEGNPPAASPADTKRKYSFYEVLPEREVQIPDEELSEQVKAEAAANLASKQQAALAASTASTAATSGTAPVAVNPAATSPAVNPVATHPATPANVATNPATPNNPATASAVPPATAANVAPATPAATAVSAAIPVPASQLKSGQYLLQAGAFRNNQQADDLKARIAMLGLVGRVETVQTPAGEMHRVRLGPYATASELEAAKQKLSGGGVQAMAVRVK